MELFISEAEIEDASMIIDYLNQELLKMFL